MEKIYAYSLIAIISTIAIIFAVNYFNCARYHTIFYSNAEERTNFKIFQHDEKLRNDSYQLAEERAGRQKRQDEEPGEPGEGEGGEDATPDDNPDDDKTTVAGGAAGGKTTAAGGAATTAAAGGGAATTAAVATTTAAAAGGTTVAGGGTTVAGATTVAISTTAAVAGGGNISTAAGGTVTNATTLAGGSSAAAAASTTVVTKAGDTTKAPDTTRVVTTTVAQATTFSQTISTTTAAAGGAITVTSAATTTSATINSSGITTTSISTSTVLNTTTTLGTTTVLSTANTENVIRGLVCSTALFKRVDSCCPTPTLIDDYDVANCQTGRRRKRRRKRNIKLRMRRNETKYERMRRNIITQLTQMFFPPRRMSQRQRQRQPPPWQPAPPPQRFEPWEPDTQPYFNPGPTYAEPTNANSAQVCLVDCVFRNLKWIGDDEVINMNIMFASVEAMVPPKWVPLIRIAKAECTTLLEVEDATALMQHSSGDLCQQAPTKLLRCIKRSLAMNCPIRISTDPECDEDMDTLRACDIHSL